MTTVGLSAGLPAQVQLRSALHSQEKLPLFFQGHCPNMMTAVLPLAKTHRDAAVMFGVSGDPCRRDYVPCLCRPRACRRRGPCRRGLCRRQARRMHAGMRTDRTADVSPAGFAAALQDPQPPNPAAAATPSQTPRRLTSALAALQGNRSQSATGAGAELNDRHQINTPSDDAMMLQLAHGC